MKLSADVGNTAAGGPVKRYEVALNFYLANSDEAGLRRGYELGREAIARGTSLLELCVLHHEALAGAVGGNGSNLQRIRDAGQFLAETLSPFHLTHLAFRETNTTLRQLNEKLESETRRIAHALHDEAGQLLTAAHLSLAEVLRDGPPEWRERIEAVTQMLHDAEEQIRGLSHELRPTMLDELGLIPALRFLADSFSRRTGLRIMVQTTCEERLPASLETALYRVAQEALANAARHSRARAVVIDVWREGGAVRCTIRDDGTGFDIGEALAPDRSTGLGLRGMRERVERIGGALNIDSGPRRGTEISATIPVET